jgi:hypothetical protein
MRTKMSTNNNKTHTNKYTTTTHNYTQYKHTQTHTDASQHTPTRRPTHQSIITHTRHPTHTTHEKHPYVAYATPNQPKMEHRTNYIRGTTHHYPTTLPFHPHTSQDRRNFVDGMMPPPSIELRFRRTSTAYVHVYMYLSAHDLRPCCRSRTVTIFVRQLERSTFRRAD